MENEDLIQKEKAQKLKKMKTAAKKEAKRLKAKIRESFLTFLITSDPLDYY